MRPVRRAGAAETGTTLAAELGSGSDRSRWHRRSRSATGHRRGCIVGRPPARWSPRRSGLLCGCGTRRGLHRPSEGTGPARSRCGLRPQQATLAWPGEGVAPLVPSRCLPRCTVHSTASSAIRRASVAGPVSDDRHRDSRSSWDGRVAHGVRGNLADRLRASAATQPAPRTTWWWPPGGSRCRWAVQVPQNA